MTVGQILRHSTAQLHQADIATARLDCLVLLEDILNKNRTHILAQLDEPMAIEQESKFNHFLQRRLRHEPLAYIRQKTEFYGRSYYIDHRVLEPRPESETLIDELKRLVGTFKPPFMVIDVGTGSGALAITAKLELPQAKVAAIDVDAGCLSVARKNASFHEAEIFFQHENLLNEFSITPVSRIIVLANLPYVPTTFSINAAAMHEPALAIFGGLDGLDVYRELFTQLAERWHKHEIYLLTESLPSQHKQLATIAETSGLKLIGSNDFIQIFRRYSGSSES